MFSKGRNARVFVRATVVAAVAVGLVGVAVPALAADGSVEGFVFRDFNSDGAYSTGNTVASGIANDVPLAGVTATAFDRSGAQVGQAVSAADGRYLIQAAGAQTTDVRIEFTFSAAQRAEGYESSYHGATSATSVQFAQLGVTGINFGANVPEDYSVGAAKATLAVHRVGDPLMAGYPDSSSVVGLDWNQNGTAITEPTVLATANGAATFGVATGSLYGLAMPRDSNIIYGSAVLRRHVGLGAAGLGGIYTINRDTTEAELFLDLSTVAGVDVGEAALTAALAAATGDTENAKRGLSTATEANTDAYAFEQAGKSGLGGMAISSDSKILYVVNLHERNLLAIDIATKAVTEISLGTLAEDERPFAVSVHRGKIHVGTVRTGEISRNNGDVAMRVITTPEAAIGSWSTVIALPLTFPRRDHFDAPGATWHAWTNTWPEVSRNFWVQDPQPVLSAITFDTDGNMILGFLDRFGFQSGRLNHNPSGTGSFSGFSNGALYGASPNGDGTYTMESGGLLSGVTGFLQGPGGPGGGLFYDNDTLHVNAVLGAAAAIPGVSTLLATVYDALTVEASDAAWIPTNGTASSLAQRVLGRTSGFAKAGGLGGVTVARSSAPVEIGNRTWYDADFDGVQDADEPVVPGVTVTLTDAEGNPVVDAAGAPVAPVRTDAGGNYYFSNLVPNKDYIVHFDGSTAVVSGLTERFGITAAAELSFTVREAGASRTVDSNADPVTGDAPVSVGGAGQNDHTIDAGFVALRHVAVTKTVTGGPAPATAEFAIELVCTDFRSETMSPVRRVVRDGGTVSAQFPAGANCTIAEVDGGGAIRTTYSTNGSAVAQRPSVLPLRGSVTNPDRVNIVNEFPPGPPVIATPPPTPPVTTPPPVTPPPTTSRPPKPPVLLSPPPKPPVVASPPPVLALTGSTLWMLIAPAAGGLLVAGAVLMLVRRRQADTN